ncbi:MAG: hypothetical protein V4532_03120 [Pseudomonadota bacterium]
MNALLTEGLHGKLLFKGGSPTLTRWGFFEGAAQQRDNPPFTGAPAGVKMDALAPLSRYVVSVVASHLLVFLADWCAQPALPDVAFG